MKGRLYGRAGALLVAVLLLVPVLASCGGETAATPTPTNTVAAPAPTATTAAEPTATTAEVPTATTAVMPTDTTAPEATSTTSGGTGAKLKVGLVTDVGKVNDGTFNQYAYEGLKKAETDFGIQTAFIETQAQTDYEKNMEQFASQGYDMIISVGFLMGDAVKSNAAKHPNIKYAIVDFSYDPPLPNVRGLVFSEDQAGYLAGVLAASMSKSNNVAVVGGMEIPPVQKYIMGYENGAKSVNPNITTAHVYIDSFTDRARGAEAAKNFMSQGSDVIFGAGGQTGSGGIQAAAQAGTWVIGVDQDEYVTTFQNGKAPGANKIISSAMKRVDNAVYLAIKDAVDGKFTGGTAVNDASTGGVGLAPFHDADAAIPADVKAKLDATLKGLADGSIKTNVKLP